MEHIQLGNEESVTGGDTLDEALKWCWKSRLARNSLLLKAGDTSVSYALILIVFLVNIFALLIISSHDCMFFWAADFVLRMQ